MRLVALPLTCLLLGACGGGGESGQAATSPSPSRSPSAPSPSPSQPSPTLAQECGQIQPILEEVNEAATDAGNEVITKDDTAAIFGQKQLELEVAAESVSDAGLQLGVRETANALGRLRVALVEGQTSRCPLRSTRRHCGRWPTTADGRARGAEPWRAPDQRGDPATRGGHGVGSSRAWRQVVT